MGSTDIVGTWTDEFLEMKTQKYFFMHGDKIMMTYGGRWSGCGWGKFDEEVYRFEWSRFNRTLGKHGILRLTDTTVLEGGLWFGKSQPKKDGSPLEKHILYRTPLNMSPERKQWVERARAFLTIGIGS